MGSMASRLVPRGRVASALQAGPEVGTALLVARRHPGQPARDVAAACPPGAKEHRVLPFVSKYLHFRCPSCPSTTPTSAGAIETFVDWRPPRASVTRWPTCGFARRHTRTSPPALYERARAEATVAERQGNRLSALAVEITARREPASARGCRALAPAGDSEVRCGRRLGAGAERPP